MKRAALYLPLLASLLNSPPGTAQCQMVGGYQMYFGGSSNNSNDTLVTWVNVSGYGQTQPPNCNPPGITHTPSAYNKLSTVGGWVSGNPVCPTCYAYVENDQTIQATPGVSYPWSYEGRVTCFTPAISYPNLQ